MLFVEVERVDSYWLQGNTEYLQPTMRLHSVSARGEDGGKAEKRKTYHCWQNECRRGLSVLGDQTTIRGGRRKSGTSIRVDDSATGTEQGQLDRH